MLYMNFFKFIFDFLIMLINPYILLFRVLYEFHKKNKYFIVTLSLFISSYYVFFVPDEKLDLYRRYEFFNTLINSNNNIGFFEKHAGLTGLSMIIDSLGFKEQALPLITSFLLLVSFFNAAYIKAGYFKYTISGVFLLFVFFCIPTYFNLVTGIRWGVAISLFVYAFSLYDKGVYKKAGVFFVLGCIFHFALIFPVFILYVSKLMPIKNTSKLLRFFIILIVLICSTFFWNILPLLVDNIRSIFGVDLSGYSSGEFGINYLKDNTGMMANYIIPMKKYLLLFLISIYIIYKPEKIRHFNVVSIMMLCYIFISSNIVISSRYTIIILFLTMFSFDYSNFSKFKVNIISGMFILFILANFYLDITINFIYYKNIFSHFFGFFSVFNVLITEIN